MPEMVSFTSITRNALRLTWEKRSLWWLTIPIGIFIGVGSSAAGVLERTLSETSPPAIWDALLSDRKLLFVFAYSFVAIVGQALLRGALVFRLAERLTSEESVKGRQRTTGTLFRAIRLSIGFESLYWLTLLSVTGILSLPCFLAWRFNPSVLATILELGSLLLLAIGMYLYFVKELSLFYAILGNVRFRLGIDLGFRLFRRQALNTALFFFYAALLGLCFTLLVGAFLSALGISQNHPSIQLTLLSALPLGLWFIFDQALRIGFFRAIAATPKKPALEEAALKTNESSSGIVPS